VWRSVAVNMCINCSFFTLMEGSNSMDGGGHDGDIIRVDKNGSGEFHSHLTSWLGEVRRLSPERSKKIDRSNTDGSLTPCDRAPPFWHFVRNRCSNSDNSSSAQKSFCLRRRHCYSLTADTVSWEADWHELLTFRPLTTSKTGLATRMLSNFMLCIQHHYRTWL